ncbi:MAG: bifunctional pyr operon transcriptional regulator/uracil phosphoribosyltransferase PyrR [Pseudomonadota bacterium]|nr:bifunctional pyr operon transcriptional regulator/uracil phosphoribosyltransferase PyrR [Pseudomonadota bacterium]
MNINEIIVEELIDIIVKEILKKLDENNWKEIKIVGIKSGGVLVANEISKLLKHKEPPGQLNITYYRDDFNKIGLHPRVEPSKLDFNIENAHVLLVDDVIHTGRTARAAMNEIFDFGRPKSITLVNLIDRGQRELPISPDILGIKIFAPTEKNIKLSGPPLKLELFDTKR